LAAQGKQVVDAGGLVVEVLGSTGFFNPATASDLDAWVATYDLNVTSVIDAPGLGMQTINALGVRETAIIIDLSTMRVIWKMNGDLGGIQPSTINAAVTEMLRLLTH
jgi:hypothetical protein